MAAIQFRLLEGVVEPTIGFVADIVCIIVGALGVREQGVACLGQESLPHPRSWGVVAQLQI